jgi:hypothetical protein
MGTGAASWPLGTGADLVDLDDGAAEAVARKGQLSLEANRLRS